MDYLSLPFSSLTIVPDCRPATHETAFSMDALRNGSLTFIFTFPCTFTRIPAIATGYTTLKLPTEDNRSRVDNVVSRSIAFEIPATPKPDRV